MRNISSGDVTFLPDVKFVTVSALERLGTCRLPRTDRLHCHLNCVGHAHRQIGTCLPSTHLNSFLLLLAWCPWMVEAFVDTAGFTHACVSYVTSFPLQQHAEHTLHVLEHTL